MSTLQVKRVPPELKARLLRQAKAQGVSLSEWVLRALEREVERAEWEERLRGREAVRLGVPAGALLEEAREERWGGSS
ncbi:protein encoded in hypervariable junctions of pilus gene clusters [Thermus oshimai JL-2]|uniref:Protein encoded in hypervariable junctions of pilus gene clusters n=1 Tax=Thermus oshimai JL-2 TaxID=751945 RepID=K7QVP3_THEOS|nr:YlcI/YnfO family protein [Thermus oshimai]AFV76666.1 protein encoded in hypervariable junctions of pilus gene clusters [Thermus oshimai JL-2]